MAPPKVRIMSDAANDPKSVAVNARGSKRENLNCAFNIMTCIISA